MKILWNIYYLFVMPQSSSEEITKFARINGLEVVKLTVSKVDAKDFKGLAQLSIS